MRTQQTFTEDFDDIYANYNDTEKGKELLRLEGISRDYLDIGIMSKNYFTKHIPDFSTDANANANEGISQNNYSSEIVKGVSKLDGLFLLFHYAKKRFGRSRATELVKAIIRGDVYFHDSTKVQVPYCFAFSTSILMTEGRNYGQLKSLPPKRSDSFGANVSELCMDLSQEFAGAIAPSDFLINLAYYTKKENASDKDIVNRCQSFCHIMNNKFRISSESPFTNLSLFDLPTLERLTENMCYPDGSKPDINYIMHIQKIFGEWFAQGDPSTGLPYRFPVVTINLSKDENGKILDEDFLDWTSKNNLGTGCFNIYINKGHKIASCCRLLSDPSRMRDFRSDSFGNGGLNLGSHRVVTLNLPRIAIKANRDSDKFTKLLKTNLDICRDLLQVHREEILVRRINLGFLKFYNPLKWFTLDSMFSTIGIIGIHEMAEMMGKEIRTDDGSNFVAKVLDTIEAYAREASTETGHAFNVEEIPGEGTAIKLCEKDKVIFGADRVPYELYSNQYIPLIDDASIPERIELSGKFQDRISGGGILHLNVKEKITDPEVMKHLIRYCVEKNTSHVAINYGFGVCSNGHTSVCGNSDTCPECGAKIETRMSRVIGYFSLVSNWQKTRREFEFPRRVFK